MPYCKTTLKAPKPPSPAYPRTLATLGEHLRKKRLDLKLLQEEVAQRLGVDKTTIHNWEKRRATPSLPSLPKIVEFLGYVPEDDTKNKSLGERILYSRRLLGLTQKKLAHHLGIDPSTLGHWERGERQPSQRLLQKLTAFLTSLPSSAAGPAG